MKKKLPLLVIVLLFFIGCSKTDDLPQTAPELKSGKMVERTIKFMESKGTMEVVSNQFACTATGFQMLIQGGGNATHLGKFSVVNTMCVTEEMLPAGPLTGELTAANGDKIYTMVTKDPWYEDGVIHYYYMILPEISTGRFEGATGYIVMYGIIDHETMTWDLKGEGKITY